MLEWTQKHPQATYDHLGYIPNFLDEADERSAEKQFDEKYCGGWNPMKGFRMLDNGDMQYPGDPPTRLLWQTVLHDQKVRVYESAWVAVVEPDGSFAVARLD